jgi:4-amino-4-deoxy-L-arabinose transferase-like glycosyltransferase
LSTESALLAVRRVAAKGREPWKVLVPLLVLEWIAEIVFASRVHHNGFVFYQGGDQIWYYTTGWLTGHGVVPKTLISPAWAFVLAPFALVVGPGYVSALPVAILIEALVLGPIALFCVYDIGSRIAGRMIGYVAAGLWVIGPYVAIPLFKQDYHSKYVDQFLPHPLGLTMMGDLPSVVCLLAAAALIVRTYQARRMELAIAAGLVTGLAVLTKASNLIFLATPVVLFLIGKRWRELGTFALALLPALGALALWKYRGYGTLPAFGNGYAPQRLALGPDTFGPAASVFTPYHKYANIDWSHLQNNLDGLAEVFFSLRVLQFLPFAGAIAVARRTWALAIALSVWFWLYFVIKGSDSVSSVDSASFFRLLLPAIPPLLLMVACLPVLVPRFGPALARRFPAPVPRIPGRRLLIAAVVLFALVPLVAAAALQPIGGQGRSIIVHEIAVPVDTGIGLRATVAGGIVRLSWNSAAEGSSRVFYRVARVRGDSDTICRSTGGAANCFYIGRPVATTRATSYVDRPGRGTFTYRVAVGTNWLDDPTKGDVFLVSVPATVTVR